MTVGSVGGTGATTGAGTVSHDVGDLAFLVALLEVETLDLDIGVRLTDMQQLNAVRKAYNEQIAELQACLDRCRDDGRLTVSADQAKRGEFVWSPEANGGTGGVVSVDGGQPAIGNGWYAVEYPDGALASNAQVLRFRPGTELSPFELEGVPDVVAREAAAAQTFRTQDPAVAAQVAAETGGTVVTLVTRDELLGEMQALRDKMDGLSSDAELGMLGLNRLLSRRNQVLQLASNVMSSQHQTAMGLIANLKV